MRETVVTENLPTRQAMRPRNGVRRAEIRAGRRQDRSGYTRRES